MARRTLLWLPPILYMGIIFALSAQSNPLPTVTEHVWDKLLHLVEYGVLAFLFARALFGEGVPWLTVLVAAILLASAYAATDEFHQAFVPGRSSDVLDWVADTLGATIAASVYTSRNTRI